MATYATLTVPVEDIIGADYDPRRTAVHLETNTPNSLIVVDGSSLRVGGRREKLGDSGTVEFANLVTTSSADNPTSFAYRVSIIYTPVGDKQQRVWTSSDFTFLFTANLADLSEAFDGLAISPTWQSEFRDEMEDIRDGLVAITGPVDSTVEALVKNTGGVGPLTKAALDVGYASQLTALGSGDETARLTAWMAMPSPIGVKRLVGSFSVSDRVVVPSGTNLDGTSATITQTGTNKITLDADSASNVTIRGITLVGKATDYTGGSPVSMGVRVRNGSNNRVIDCNATGHAGVGVKMEACTESVVRGCRIIGTSPPSFDKDQYGILFETTCQRVRAEGNIISAVAQGIIASMATAGIQVVNNMIYNVTGQHGIYLQNGTDTLIEGNWISGTAYQGMKVQMTASSPSDGEGMNIIGNHVDSAVSHGILLDNTDPAPTFFFKAVNVSGNTVTSCGEDAFSINDVSGAVIAHNVVRGGRAGMSIANSDALLIHGNRIASTTAEGIKLDKVSGSEIVRNRIVNPASANIGSTEHGIRVTTFNTVSDLIFDDNQISDNLGNMRYGIYIEAGAEQTTITFRRNRVTGATDYGCRLQASTAVREWVGNDFNGTLGKVLNLPADYSKGSVVTETFGAAAPTTGTWTRGDRVWHTAPAASGVAGWICTTGGTPGTWKTFGAISA